MNMSKESATSSPFFHSPLLVKDLRTNKQGSDSKTNDTTGLVLRDKKRRKLETLFSKLRIGKTVFFPKP